MERFFQIYDNLLKQLGNPIRRQLEDEIDQSNRLIGIKGTRGVGKTTFLLQYGRDNYPNSNECLYINMNHLYFTTHSLVNFAKSFNEIGGKVLLIDQVYKYPNWVQALADCHAQVPNIQIVFAGPSAMRLKDENPILHDIVAPYFLRGFSFREYLNLRTSNSFNPISLDDLIRDHSSISNAICQKINPLDYFQDYLRHGFYPFFLEKCDFTETLIKTVNMMIEGDIFFLKEIQVTNFHKIRRLLYLLSNNYLNAPLNISQLSLEIETSRATVMNYIKYLMEARLINMLYPYNEKVDAKKPSRIYLHNTNLIYSLMDREVDEKDLYETFFYNSMYKDHKLYSGNKSAQFNVNGTTFFRIEPTELKSQIKGKPKHLEHLAIADIAQSTQEAIPLWLFGFLY